MMYLIAYTSPIYKHGSFLVYFQWRLRILYSSQTWEILVMIYQTVLLASYWPIPQEKEAEVIVILALKSEH